MKTLIVIFSMTALVTVLFPAAGSRGDDTVVELRFENRHFTPQTITVPANQALTLRITNVSKEPIEFESFKLNREKVVGPGETVVVRLPALRPGSYDFYDDFHKMFRQDRLSPNKKLNNLRILNGKQDPDRCYDGIARLSTDRAIYNGPAHQSTAERRSCGSAAHQNPTQASLL